MKWRSLMFLSLIPRGVRFRLRDVLLDLLLLRVVGIRLQPLLPGFDRALGSLLIFTRPPWRESVNAPHATL